MRVSPYLALVFLASERVRDLGSKFACRVGSAEDAVSFSRSHPNLFHVYVLDVGSGARVKDVEAVRRNSPHSALLVVRSASDPSPDASDFYTAGCDLCHVFEAMDGEDELRWIVHTLLSVVAARHEASWRRRLETLAEKVFLGAEWDEIGGLVLGWFQSDGFARGRLYHMAPSTDSFECLLSSSSGSGSGAMPAGRFRREELEPILEQISHDRLTRWNWSRLCDAFAAAGRDIPPSMRAFYYSDDEREWLYVTVTNAGEVIANIALDRIGSPIHAITELDCRCLEMVASRVPHLLSRVLEAELSIRASESQDAIVHEDARFDAVLERARRIAGCSEPVLIFGETGVGKEIIARTIHAASPRSGEEFVATNCAELSKDLTNAAFGSVRGAFTGALDRTGIFETADGGTLFLDEVGDLNLEVQAMLLRVTDTGEFRRVGESTPRRTDVRIICATNKNLEQEVAAGRFRRDLYFRIAGYTIEIPPLRERPEDVLAWAGRVLQAQSEQLGVPVRLSPEVHRILLSYTWPGNFRQLKSVLRTALTLAGSESVIRPEHLPRLPASQDTGETVAPLEVLERLLSGSETFWEAVQVPYRRRAILRTTVQQVVEMGLNRAGGSYKGCARLFGLAEESDYKRFMDFLRIHDLKPEPGLRHQPESRADRGGVPSPAKARSAEKSHPTAH